MAATLTVLGGIASAATTSFDFSGNSWPTDKLSFSSGGVNVDVTGTGFYTATGGLSGSKFKVARYSGGLGICSGVVSAWGIGGCWGDNHQIDGFWNEMAVLKFDREVTIDSAGFSLIGDNDDFVFRAYDGASAGTYFQADPGANGSPTYSFLGTYTGTHFGIGAQGANDEFKLRSLTVSYEDTPEVPAVPLPAAGLLLATAFGGLGGLRSLRRKG